MNEKERRERCFEIARKYNGKHFDTKKEVLRFFGYSEKSNLFDTFANAHILPDNKANHGWKIIAKINISTHPNGVHYMIYDWYLIRTSWWKYTIEDHKYILEGRLEKCYYEI